MKRSLFLFCFSLLAIYAVSQNVTRRTSTVVSTTPAPTTVTESSPQESSIVVSPVVDQVHTGVACTPELTIRDGNTTLVKDRDYTINYINNVNVGTATITIIGKGNYRDIKEIKFNILAKPIGSLMINPINDQTFRNSLISPDILIKDGAKVLVRDTDYTLTFANNFNVGTASVTITGKGNYKDTKVMNFRIVAKSMSGRNTPSSRPIQRPTQRPTTPQTTSK